MLEADILAAVGKSVGADDFATYMAWHNERLFRAEFRPRPFSLAVRRPGRAPCGTVAVVAGDGGAGANDAINTTTVEQRLIAPMRFALNAATDVELHGATFLHSTLLQARFFFFVTVTLCLDANQPSHNLTPTCEFFLLCFISPIFATLLQSFDGGSTQLQLVARARQFGAFILMVGKLAAADVFDPVAAIVVSNKVSTQIRAERTVPVITFRANPSHTLTRSLSPPNNAM